MTDRERLEHDGVAIEQGVLDATWVKRLREAMDSSVQCVDRQNTTTPDFSPPRVLAVSRRVTRPPKRTNRWVTDFCPDGEEGKTAAAHRQSKGGYARRGLLRDVPSVRALATSEPIRRLVGRYLSEKAVAVRGLYFDKPAEANWKVAWCILKSRM